MTEEQINEWIAALEDPKTKKGVNVLENRNGEMCCLGVLANLQGVPKNGENMAGDKKFVFGAGNTCVVMPPTGWMGIHMRVTLIDLNDSNDTFQPVIEYLKANKHDFID